MIELQETRVLNLTATKQSVVRKRKGSACEDQNYTETGKRVNEVTLVIPSEDSIAGRGVDAVT